MLTRRLLKTLRLKWGFHLNCQVGKEEGIANLRDSKALRTSGAGFQSQEPELKVTAWVYRFKIPSNKPDRNPVPDQDTRLITNQQQSR